MLFRSVAKELHIPIVSYIPPSAWAWRPGRATMSNFKDTFNLLTKVGALRQVSNGDELAGVFLEIFKDDELRAKMGAASFQVIRENRGAAVRTINYLQEVLDITATESMVNTHYKVNTRNINDEISPKMRTGDAVTQYLIKLSHD